VSVASTLDPTRSKFAAGLQHHGAPQPRVAADGEHSGVMRSASGPFDRVRRAYVSIRAGVNLSVNPSGARSASGNWFCVLIASKYEIRRMITANRATLAESKSIRLG